MDSHFKDHINLPNSHNSVLGHCKLFTIEKMIFEVFDQIAPKLGHKIRRKKKSRMETPVEGTSYNTSPLKNPKFHRLDPFFIFYILRKIWKKIALVLFDF